MKLLYLIMCLNLSILLSSCCTYSITMVHTQGEASDVVDDTDNNTPNTTISPNLSIPAM